jgi:glycosyltransferase involved in cell wall biosynthesis
MYPSYSIIIPAWHVEGFIKECLDSIVKQRYPKDAKYEILLGIDNCEKTLAAVKAIKSNYAGLKVFWFKQNVGPYIVRNTLSFQALHNVLVFFDADDIMYDKYIETVSPLIRRNDSVYYRCTEFDTPNKKNIRRESVRHIPGSFVILTDTFKRVGGYMPWRCAADTEFHDRLKRNGISRTILEQSLIYRRVHPDSLCQRADTALQSPLREQYRREIVSLVHLRRVKPVFAEFEIIK